jgi:prepilin-type processing-associated H-X9-DG protein
LISVLLPALGRAREASQKVACASNLRQIGLGLAMYCQENHGQLFQFREYYNDSIGLERHDGYWTRFFMKYLGDKKDYTGSNNYPASVKLGQEAVYGGSKILKCPANPSQSINTAAGDASYGVNYVNVFSEIIWEYNSLPGQSGLGSSKKLRKCKTEYLFADSMYDYNYPFTYFIPTVDTDGDGVSDTRPGYNVMNSFAPRHPKKAINLLFADGSVKSMTLNEIIRNKENVLGSFNRP